MMVIIVKIPWMMVHFIIMSVKFSAWMILRARWVVQISTCWMNAERGSWSMISDVLMRRLICVLLARLVSMIPWTSWWWRLEIRPFSDVSHSSMSNFGWMQTMIIQQRLSCMIFSRHFFQWTSYSCRKDLWWDHIYRIDAYWEVLFTQVYLYMTQKKICFSDWGKEWKKGFYLSSSFYKDSLSELLNFRCISQMRRSLLCAGLLRHFLVR